MDPLASPIKFTSPGMSTFAVSPDRAAGMKARYGDPPMMSPSPSTSNLRSHSPLRNSHRRNDSDVSVQGLAVLFENLEVKDPREASKRFKEALEKEKTRNAEKLSRLEKEYAKRAQDQEMALSRRDIRIEELQNELEQASSRLEVGVTKANYEREYKANRAKVAQWEQTFRENEEKWRSTGSQKEHYKTLSKAYEEKYRSYKKQCMEATKENLKISSKITNFQTKVQSLERVVQRAESDVKFKTEEASKYKIQVYSLQVEIESISTRLGDEVQTLKDAMKLVEEERDALKTSLKEEEVMRVAAEGSIALPAAGADENDEFESPIRSPVRSPRKQRTFPRDEDDKENVSPKKGAVELRFLQQELTAERRLRERAQDQIEFMKMECQFQCCSCRIAENQGKHYVHDDTYAVDMERIRVSVPALTPPPSNHGDDAMEDVKVDVKQELAEIARPFTPPLEDSLRIEQDGDMAEAHDSTTLVHPPSAEPETIVAFSPSTGTFRSIPSPVKATSSATISVPAQPMHSVVMEVVSSPCAPDTHSNIVSLAAEFPVNPRPVSRAEPTRNDRKENKVVEISIHEDVLYDSDEEDAGPPSPTQEPIGPATPYLTRTITTTTTIPLHFSPATPAFKPGRGPMTPSTVAHAAANAQTPVLGELSLNKLPFDREAALEAIRQRRGRARSMAGGSGTPMKQMVEGVKDRRDISAPVSRVRK